MHVRSASLDVADEAGKYISRDIDTASRASSAAQAIVSLFQTSQVIFNHPFLHLSILSQLSL